MSGKQPKYIVAARAQTDLVSIASYTEKQWSARQAERYLHSFYVCFALIASQPSMGRMAKSVNVEMRRHEHQNHVIYYRITPHGIRVLRVIHQQSLPQMRDVSE